MLGFEKNSSQNQSDDDIKDFKISGWEIVPYVPPKVEYSSSFSTEKEAQMFKILKKVVTASVRLVKPTSPVKDGRKSGGAENNKILSHPIPVDYTLPEDCDDVQGAIMRVEKFIAENSSQNFRLRYATSLVGEVSISFELPDDFPPKGVEIDKLSSPEEKRTQSTIAQNQRRFSFAERLKGWKIERRQRVKGRHDMYYRHDESKTLLRSAVEVVNFLLYEQDPYRQKRAQNKTTTTPVEGSEGRKRKRSEQKIKKPSSHPNSQSSGSKPNEVNATTPAPNANVSLYEQIAREKEIQRKLVEEFYAEARNNLLNSTSFVRQSFDIGNQDDGDTDSEATQEEIDKEEFFRKSRDSRNNVTPQGINKRNAKGKGIIHSEETYSEISSGLRYAESIVRKEADIGTGNDLKTSPGTIIPLVQSDHKKLEPILGVTAKAIRTDQGVTSSQITNCGHLVGKSDNISEVGEGHQAKIVRTSGCDVNAVENFDLANKAKETISASTSLPRDVQQVSVAKVEADVGIAVEAKAESSAGAVEAKAESSAGPARKPQNSTADHHGLVILSSLADEVDLINHIPLADNFIIDDLSAKMSK